MAGLMGNATDSGSQGKVSSGYPPGNLTVGEDLDRKIANARVLLEHLCIIKAKAEAAQMLNHPMSFVYDIVSY